MLDIDTAPTIESLYTKIDNCLNSSVCEIRELTFDQDQNYPDNYYKSTGEEGWGFRISEVIVL